MATNRGFGVRLSIALATATGTCLLAASPALADTGSVYFDHNDNAAAGETFFDALQSGFGNVGLGRSVMPNLTTGNRNIATGTSALFSNTRGDDNVATGFRALTANTSGSANVATGAQTL